MSELGIEELAEILDRDNQFLAGHYDELIEQYPGQIVAVQDGEVVAAGEREVEAYCTSRQEAGLVGPLLLLVPHPGEWTPFLL